MLRQEKFEGIDIFRKSLQNFAISWKQGDNQWIYHWLSFGGHTCMNGVVRLALRACLSEKNVRNGSGTIAFCAFGDDKHETMSL